MLYKFSNLLAGSLWGRVVTDEYNSYSFIGIEGLCCLCQAGGGGSSFSLSFPLSHDNKCALVWPPCSAL